MSRKNLIVGQSGGPTAVINSSLYGVVSEGMRHPEAIEHVYGMINGIEGFLNGTVLDFAEALPGDKLDGLKVTPGAYLGSCRYKLPEIKGNTDFYDRIFNGWTIDFSKDGFKYTSSQYRKFSTQILREVFQISDEIIATI